MRGSVSNSVAYNIDSNPNLIGIKAENTSPHKYRADIDGLRAFAVMAVVIFHSFPDLLQGGFVGVDVFFVISGYLISSIIFQSYIRREGVADFYFRRIRRIFPALIAVMMASLSLGWFVLFSGEYKQLGKHVAGGAAFVANFVLYDEAGYFDDSVETKPLLHLWSLGVEEQFYIIFPLLVWFVYKFKYKIIRIVFFLGVASFLANVLWVKIDQPFAFYMPYARFFELMVGSVLAWVRLKNELATFHEEDNDNNFFGLAKTAVEARLNRPCVKNISSLIGIATLAISFLFTEKNEFPGWVSMLPVIGAALLIFAGEEAWSNKFIMSNRFAVGIGKISYPLYLWHWPLLVFARIVYSDAFDTTIRIQMVVLSIVLAWLTYQFLEKPVRFYWNAKKCLIILVLSMIFLGAAGYSVFNMDGLGYRHANQQVLKNKFDAPYKQSCELLMGEYYGDDWCNSGVIKMNHANYLLVGDSFSNAYVPMLTYYSEKIDFDFSFVQYARGQCPLILNYGPIFCKNITQRVLDRIRSDDYINTVILASDWAAYFNGKTYGSLSHHESAEGFKDSFEATLDLYINSGKRVIVFFAPPRQVNPKSCVVRAINFGDHKNCNLLYEEAVNRELGYRSYMISILDKKNIKYFDPLKYMCIDGVCKVAEGDEIFYGHGHHLSVFGGEYLAKNGSAELKLLLGHGG